MKNRIQPSSDLKVVQDFIQRHGSFQVISFLRGPLDGVEVESSNFQKTIVLPVNTEIVDQPGLLADSAELKLPISSLAIYQLSVLNEKLYYAFRGGTSCNSGK